MEKLHGLLAEIEKNISKQDVINTAISKSNVGWHLEHVLLVMNKAIESIKKSDPSNYKWSFKISRLIIFTTNKIPRGRAKSPKIVAPKTYDEQTLKQHVEIARIKINELSSISKDNYFSHPFFGDLKLNKGVKFIQLHTNHHLKIINDILASNK